MKNTLLKVSIVVGATVLGIGSVQARDDGSFQDYVDDMAEIRETILSHCNAEAEALEIPQNLADDLDDPRFAQACGKALQGRAIEETTYSIFYHYQYTRAGSSTLYLGVRKPLAFSEDRYMLVNAWLSQADPEGFTVSGPDALLMAFFQGRWQLAWRYVDVENRGWHQPAGSNQAGALSGNLAKFIDGLREEEVVRAMDELAARLSDRHTLPLVD